MAYIHPDVLDDGLQEITDDATAIHIVSTAGDPADRAAVLADTLGNRAVAVGVWEIPNPSDRGAGGREIVVPAVADGTVTDTDTATRWALIDGARLLACNTLAAPQGVTNGNTFTLTSFTIGKPNPA